MGEESHRADGSSEAVATHEIEIVRPLIDVTRRQVLGFLRARGQAWREDETNTSEAFTRNRIRAELLAHLRAEFNPKVDEALARLSDQAAAAAEVLRDALDAAWRQLVHELPPQPDAEASGNRPRAIVFAADGFAALRPWLQGAVLRRAIEILGGGLKHMGARRTEEVVQALLSDHVAGPVELPGDLAATRRRGAIRIEPRASRARQV